MCVGIADVSERSLGSNASGKTQPNCVVRHRSGASIQHADASLTWAERTQRQASAEKLCRKIALRPPEQAKRGCACPARRVYEIRIPDPSECRREVCGPACPGRLVKENVRVKPQKLFNLSGEFLPINFHSGGAR
jgi:hypothetical protein